MQWLDSLRSDQQHDIVELARKSRVQVKKAYNSAEDDRRKFRQERMIQEKKKTQTPLKNVQLIKWLDCQRYI